MRRILPVLFALFFPLLCHASSQVNSYAWSRDIGAGGYVDGAPIGGFGAGNVTWKFDGTFYKDRLVIGTGTDNGSFITNDAVAKFYMYQKPASGTATSKKLDAATLGSGQAKYYSLFPLSWVDYYGSQFTVKAKVTQFSPIIPGDYQRVSYPVGIYEWEVSNPGSENCDAAIMLTWQNNYSGASCTAASSGSYRGIVFHRSGTAAPTLETEGEFALGTYADTGVTVSYLSAASVSAIETDFSADGALAGTTGANTIGAIAFKVTLAPGETRRIPIVLAWDIPICQVGSGNKWWKRYTRYFGKTGRNAWGIALESLQNRASWESQIDAWQDSVTGNLYYPSWLKSMLFNELYIYFTAGTYWEAGPASGQADADTTPAGDMFSHLESYIYDFYGTSDVRFYGSWALFLNWPDIDKQAVRQFADSVYNTRSDRPAGIGTTAHDFGDRNTLFTQWNAYVYRDSTNWKDLNSKLVLMVYRDWKLSGGTDGAFLNYCWEPVKRALAKVKSQDSDADGLPNSSGIDQTYDDMDLTGNTAYCGGLFLAACRAGAEIASALGNTAQAATYQAWFDLAQPNYESKLWTGSYYKIDTGSFDTTRIMSDQMCGQWYAKACGLQGIVSDAHAASAYQAVYNNNFMKFGAGSHGVCNVFNAAGTIDTSTPQTQECWAGTSWGVVSGMVHEGMTAQANAIGQSLQNTIWNTAQYWFRTPEAWRVNLGSPRAFYYMRGTTIWGAKHAYDMLPLLCGSTTCTPPPTATFTNTPTPTPTVNPCAQSLRRVNCGYTTGTVTDSLGRTWSADQAYAAGGWGYVGGSGTENPVTGAIANTEDDVLYQTGRWGTGIEYRFTVANGTWRVKLRFAEIYFAGAGSRVFNVFIEGQQVLTAFDPAANGAMTARDFTFDVPVTDGVINITTSNVTDSPKFSAIEILDSSYVCTPTVTWTYAGSPTNTRTVTPTRTNTPYYSPTFTLTNTPYYSPTVTPTHTISPTFTATQAFTPIRVNCAGPQYTDAALNVWLADQAYAAGSWGYTYAGNTNTRADAIAGTTDDTLYHTERWNATLGYDFDIPDGTYQVTLCFCETWFGLTARGGGGTGSRRFNASLEGTQVLTDFDVYAVNNAADYAVNRTFTVDVADGQLNILLTTGAADVPMINAIQIIKLNPTPTPTYSYSPAVSPSFTATSTVTRTATATATYTSTRTMTHTAVSTATQAASPTFTPTVTQTAEATAAWTATQGASPTLTVTASQTAENTATRTATQVSTAANTGTATPQATWTHTATFTPVSTATGTPTGTLTATVTATCTVTQTSSVSPTVTQTWTGTPPTQTFTPTVTRTPTVTYTPTSTATFTHTQTSTLSVTRTFTATNPPTAAPTPSFTATVTPSRTATASPTAPSTATHTVTLTATLTRTETATQQPTFTATPTMTALPPADGKPCVYPAPYYSAWSGGLNFALVLSKDAEVTVRIYTVSGRLVRQLECGAMAAGSRTAVLDRAGAAGLGAGTYYYVVEYRRQQGISRSAIQPLIILK